jgi:DNA-binding protein HU-beta
MTKQELVTLIAEKTGIRKDTVALVVDETHEAITATMKKGEQVKIGGFGTFYVLDKPERKGRNPFTGETIQISARRLPKFRPMKALKESL